MGGGLIQLAAIGAQNAYLTGNPQITYFVAVYKRHTNFSIECIEQLFTGNATFGKKVFCDIDRVGDLIGDIFLVVKLPKLSSSINDKAVISWTNSIGHALIKYIDLEIGETVIDKQYGIWLQIWSELTVDASKREAFNMMIGKKENFYNTLEAEEMNLYIPLYFWFCNNPGLSLPLIALQHHVVRINLGIRDLSELWVSEDGTPPDNVDITSCSLYVDYIFLDDKERVFFAQNTHNYLITQLQISSNALDASRIYKCRKEDTTICIECDEEEKVNEDYILIRKSDKGDTTMVDLKFNHPVKELLWIIQNSDILEMANGKGNDWFNFSDKPFGCSDGSEQCDPMINAKLILDGVDRMETRDAKYFRLVQPFQRHTCVPANNYIYVYSFGYNPEKYQPSGTLNFSRIDNSIFEISIVGGIKRPVLQMFATNYNILRIMGGMAGVVYNN
tara:strand:- start:3589 stop:4926 length:1338 start_codon:yes stop_codon:yes gene_type:complete